MASPRETAVFSEQTTPGQRTCRICTETKAESPETWVYKKGKIHGLICLSCEKERKGRYDRRRQKLIEDSRELKSIASEQKGKDKDRNFLIEDARKTLTKAAKLEVAYALKIGSRVLNETAPSVMARITEYLEDPHHEHHLWALEFLAQRMMPRKLYEELGGQAAGVGAIADRRPSFTINVIPAQPAAAGGNERVIQGEVVHVSEARADESDDS